MRGTFVFLLVLVVALGVPGSTAGSDHADPVTLDSGDVREPNITGLFVFPDGDRLVVVLNVFRGLSTPPPYELERFESVISIDWTTEVDFGDSAVRARYGGEVVDPASIAADATLTIRLAADASLAESHVEGLADPGSIRWYAGVRDDPFIFPRFFGRNVISTVASLPLTSLPAGRQDFLFWAVTRPRGGGEPIDYVGRSARTQLPRFGFLNGIEPANQVAAIHRKSERGDRFARFLMRRLAPVTDFYEYTLKLRHYDLHPDVLVYTSRFPAGYPNGRRLEDDVVGLTCAVGDCILQELAMIDSEALPRQTVNDRELSSEFPYLGEPWPEREPMPAPSGGLSNRALLALSVGGLALLFGAAVWWWVRRRRS